MAYVLMIFWAMIFWGIVLFMVEGFALAAFICSGIRIAKEARKEAEGRCPTCGSIKQQAAAIPAEIGKEGK